MSPDQETCPPIGGRTFFMWHWETVIESGALSQALLGELYRFLHILTEQTRILPSKCCAKPRFTRSDFCLTDFCVVKKSVRLQ